MYRYKGKLMSLCETQNKIRFSKELLEELAQNQLKVPVFMGFVGDPIGSVTGLEMIDDSLICSFDLRYPNLNQLNVFLVPSGLVRSNELHQDENGTTVISKMQLDGVSISSEPADQTLTKIESE